MRVAHVRWFARGENTIFGDYADPKEVFALYDCEDLELHRFMRKLQIQYIPTADNWKDQGGTSDSLVTPSNFIGAEDNIFWYRKSYHPDTARYILLFFKFLFKIYFSEILVSWHISPSSTVH